MWGYIVSQIDHLMQVARENYGVNPIIFIVIYLGCTPIFYYSLYRTVRALAKKHWNQAVLWGGIFLCANIAPFLYVLIFGRNIPWWVYGIIPLLIGLGVLSLVMKFRKKKANALLPPQG